VGSGIVPLYHSVKATSLRAASCAIGDGGALPIAGFGCPASASPPGSFPRRVSDGPDVQNPHAHASRFFLRQDFFASARPLLPSRSALGYLRAESRPCRRLSAGCAIIGREIFVGKAQTFADSMPISRIRGKLYLTGFSSGQRPFFQPRWPLVDIGRTLAKA
jgi:hypothetical protein